MKDHPQEKETSSEAGLPKNRSQNGYKKGTIWLPQCSGSPREPNLLPYLRCPFMHHTVTESKINGQSSRQGWACGDSQIWCKFVYMQKCVLITTLTRLSPPTFGYIGAEIFQKLSKRLLRYCTHCGVCWLGTKALVTWSIQCQITSITHVKMYIHS